jgi:hypothetical protein
MAKTVDKKQTKLPIRKKKGVDMAPFAGKVKAFKKIDGLSYQKKIRSND